VTIMAHSIVSDESTLTDRYQTTIPSTIRKVLGLSKQDKIHYSIQANGSVIISRVEKRENDPIIEKFLNFISNDIETNPQDIKAINSDLIDRFNKLELDTDIDLDAPLSEDD